MKNSHKKFRILLWEVQRQPIENFFGKLDDIRKLLRRSERGLKTFSKSTILLQELFLHFFFLKIHIFFKEFPEIHLNKKSGFLFKSFIQKCFAKLMVSLWNFFTKSPILFKDFFSLFFVLIRNPCLRSLKIVFF